MSILHITSSISPTPSTSTMLGHETASALGSTVITRDVNEGIPALTTQWAAANFTPAEARTEADKQQLALSDTLIAEVMAADALVISTPMYNFSVPSTLKAWVDQICRAGITFNYSADGPEGLIKGKRAIVVIASGGVPVGSPADFCSNYLRFVLGFIGITDVTIIAADQMNVDADKALAGARTAIAAL